VFLLSSLCTQSSAQTVEDSLLERIAYYQEVDSFELFFQTLKKLSRHYKSYDDRFYKVIDSFEKFTPYRKAKSKEESILIRGYYASLIYALDYDSSLYFYKLVERSLRENSEPIAITAAFEKLCSFSLDTDDLESYKSYKLQFQKHLLLTPNDPDKDKRLRMLLEMEANYNYQSGINDNALIILL